MSISRPVGLRRLAGLISCCAVLSLGGEIRGQGAWPDERTAGPFVCHADFPLSSHVSLLREMEHLQQNLGEELSIKPPQEPIHMFLFDQKSTYQQYIQRYFPNVPFRQALFIKERGPGMVFAYRSQDFEVDLRHESTHALLHAALPMVPLWLDEGLAEYFEVRSESRARSHPHLSKVRWAARLGRVPAIQELEAIHTLSDMGQVEYRNSWAWVHFMFHGAAEAKGELVRYVSDIQSHTPPGKLSERLQQQLPDLERRFADHFRTWR